MLQYFLNDEELHRVMSSLSTMHEACDYLLQKTEDELTVKHMTRELDELTQHLMQFLYQKFGSETDCPVLKLLKSFYTSNLRVFMRANETAFVHDKVKYEMVPIAEETYHYAFFYFYALRGKAQMAEYTNCLPDLCGNRYVMEAEDDDTYKYDVALVIIAYNNLRYTKLCVDNLLKNIPERLKYELVLINHGSSDGTQAYFESVHPTKQIDIAVNGVGFCISARVIESKYILGISNDVIVGINAVQNLITCIESNASIGCVVPATPNVSNFQSIPSSYTDIAQMQEFSAWNNISDAYRWEQRIRLCDPISIVRSSIYYGKNGIFSNRLSGDGSSLAFPDDRSSLRLRRRGYKLYLAKDAYCHHFGSLTIQDELKKKQNENMYLKGRKAFYNEFGVDPWGIGFCYDFVFAKCVIEKSNLSQSILGINCGFGANSLKVKEQFKEYSHNLDVTLTNITDNEIFLDDLRGISDNAFFISDIQIFKKYMEENMFDYIVWEDGFCSQYNFMDVLPTVLFHLAENGILFIKQNEENAAFLNYYRQYEIGNGWHRLKKEEITAK